MQVPQRGAIDRLEVALDFLQAEVHPGAFYPKQVQVG